MMRYSASRGIIYSAPPGPDGSRADGEWAVESGDGTADERSAEALDASDPAMTDAAADD